MPIPNQRVRVGGSGFTVFHWDGGDGDKIIGFAENVSVQGVQPVAQAQVIQPINYPRPVEIITPAAHTNGTLTLTLTELYNKSVWQRLSSLTACQDIVDIMRTIAENGQGVSITKYIRPPAGIGGETYRETFKDCVVASVEDNEVITIDAMRIDKTMTVMYTYSIKSWINNGQRKYPYSFN